VTTFHQLILWGIKELSPITDEAKIEIEHILTTSFKIDTTKLILNLNCKISSNKSLALFKSYIKKRKTGVPLGYVLGKWHFRENLYYIKKGVLIPRPETELLVEKAIRKIAALLKDGKKVNVIEVGFGSGIISIELALTFKGLHLHAWDISKKAFEVANENASKLRTSNISFYNCDFFKSLPTLDKLINNKAVNIIISNPPYIPSYDINSLEKKVKDFEPKTALNGGKSGLVYYKKLFKLINTYANLNFAFEIGIQQKEQLLKLLKNYKTKNIEFENDLNNIPRVLWIES
jgi:release factor glutamine methyltransferase